MSRTVWITGGKGFIGRNLAKYIASQDCDVFGIGHGFWTQQESDTWSYQSWMNAEIEFANLNQLASKSGKPDIIYHLAGGSAVGPSIDKPFEDFNRTVNTTARLLEWVRKSAPNTKVVGISSAAVYGSGKSGRINEDSSISPFSPYGFHKHMLELLFQSYQDNFGLDLAIVRLFSVYGPGLEKQLLWDVCNKISNADSQKILLHGTGGELRDWLHISDTVELLWAVGRLEQKKGLVLNGGTGVATSIRDVANGLVKHWKEDVTVKFSGQTRIGDPESLIADTTLAESLGFKAKVDWDSGLAEIVEWFKERVG